MIIPFTAEIEERGDLLTVEDYNSCVDHDLFTDYDGSGNPVFGDKETIDEDYRIFPSCRELPEGTTYVLWYNR